jgi:predicted DNA-binding protein
MTIRNKYLNVRLSEFEKEQLDRLAKERHMKSSEFVRFLIIKQLEEEKAYEVVQEGRREFKEED